MLREIKTSKTIDNDLIKRWFNDHEMDLIVWANENGDISKFQLCYDKNYSEHALTWNESTGFRHNKVDDGEGRSGRHKGTPILVSDGIINIEAIASKFIENSTNIDINILNFIHDKLLEYQD